jgi:hypothetical protein
MSEFVSDTKRIPYSNDRVFVVLSDLSNLEKLKDHLPTDKMEGFSCDSDSCTFSVDPVGQMTVVVDEREPHETIKFTTQRSPIPMDMWIHLEPVAPDHTQMKITVSVGLPPLLKPMVSQPLRKALDNLANLLASLPY